MGVLWAADGVPLNIYGIPRGSVGERGQGRINLCTAAPWCAPWYTEEVIEVTGNDPKEWGAQYWEQCKDEIERFLVVEEEC